MIPIRLSLRNFMSYTDIHEPLEFTGIHVAVLSGDNGHGKSALLDAITWSMWGKSRAKSVDDLIHTGETEMEVEFEFALEGEQYRVIRKRQRRGKTGLSDLQFSILSNGSYRPLTERSLGETERAIERTLKMSYETFTNSSFIQQGRADSFTVNQPADRKRILAEILELGYYDELETRAKDALREREMQLGEERARAREWEQEVAHLPEYQAEADRLAGQLGEAEERTRMAESACNLSRERVARLEASRQQLVESEGRLQRFAEDRDRARAALAETRAKLSEAQDVLQRGDEIQRAAAELDTVRAQLQEADARLQAYLPLARAREKAAAELKAEQVRLEAHLTLLMQQLAEQRKLAEPRPAADGERRAAAAEIDELQRLERQRQELQTVAVGCREEAAEKRTINTQLKGEMEQLRARIEELGTLETCPACRRPIDASHRSELRASYEAQGKDLAARFRTNEKIYRKLEGTVAGHDAELARLAERLASREAAQQRFAAAESAVARAMQAEQRLGSVQAELSELEKILAEHRVAPEARAELAEAEASLTVLAYDEAAHGVLRSRAAALAAAEGEQRRFEQARVAAEHLGNQARELAASLRRLEEECQTEERRRDTLRQESADYEAERAKLQQAEEQLRQAQLERDRLRDLHAKACQRVDYGAFVERRLKESVGRQDALIREQSIYAELAHAFGKKGVQAMIIETAIPEIDEEANRLLARMTDGRMNVKLETQRDTRTGSGTIETLDIKISDELGTRNYEMFSGGESFRVNFAIRIALSKLLARRAGTKLQTLVVDEGFGSQDQDGRDRIVEAIQAIQDEFEKILVITHLEDLRERFPVRIEVTKTPRGSTFALR